MDDILNLDEVEQGHMSFPILTLDMLGTRPYVGCEGCNRLLTLGDPFVWVLTEVNDDHLTGIQTATCVYCAYTA